MFLLCSGATSVRGKVILPLYVGKKCLKCGEDHKIQDYRDDVQDKCCNCGQHRAAYGGCEIRKRVVEVQKVKTTNNLSYAEAVEKVQEQQRSHVGSIVVRQEPKRIGRNSSPVEYDKLIFLIDYVNNSTDQDKHKSEKRRMKS